VASAAPRRRPRRHTGEQPAEKAILEATERLLATSSLHEISVAQILLEAGLSRASFYHYFSDKYEVVATRVSQVFNEIYAETHAEYEVAWTDPAVALRTSLGTGIATWYAHRYVIQAVLENWHASPVLEAVWVDVSDRFSTLVADQIRREQGVGHVSSSVPAAAVAALLVRGAQRIFYVGSTESDPRLAAPEHGLEAIVTLALAAIYGDPRGRQPSRRTKWARR
jgi:AcrR family transcriptional regulator